MHTHVLIWNPEIFKTQNTKDKTHACLTDQANVMKKNFLKLKTSILSSVSFLWFLLLGFAFYFLGFVVGFWVNVFPRAKARILHTQNSKRKTPALVFCFQERLNVSSKPKTQQILSQRLWSMWIVYGMMCLSKPIHSICILLHDLCASIYKHVQPKIVGNFFSCVHLT